MKKTIETSMTLTGFISQKSRSMPKYQNQNQNKTTE